MKLTIHHQPAPQPEGIPASEAPEGVPLRVVRRKPGYTFIEDDWVVRWYDRLIGIGGNIGPSVKPEEYRVVPLGVGDKLTIERSE